MHPLHTMPVMLTGSNVEKKREEIRVYFHKSYDLFEDLFTVLKDDSVFYEQPEATRHPLIFYFGHTATFYVNKFLVAKMIDDRLTPEFESMFAIGVDEMNWDDMDSEHYRWPEVSAVRAYRDDVRRLVDSMISTLPLTLPITQESPWWIILMGIEHEHIHTETSSVLHRQLPIEKVKSVASFPVCPDSGPAPQNEMIDIEGGDVRLGKEKEDPLYGWDNEYGEQVEHVKPFKAAKYLCSNGEYLAFVNDGGYTDERYWDKEGRKFLEITSASYPSFWVKKEDGSFAYRALTQVIDMPLNWPVDVNYLEAKAYCRWLSDREDKKFRLLSEAEWYLLYERAGIKNVPDFDDASANINLAHYASSCPVDRFAFGDIYDIVGNVWQWTESPIYSFKGFEPHYAYDDFSVPTFDGKHNLIKGGSWISCGNELMKHSRYAFRRHFYQHAGFRVIEGEEMTIEENIYESDVLVSQYCNFQYGDEYFGVPNFAIKCAEFALEYAKKTPMKNALDLGCATGRASFELALGFENVTGIDFSARFVQVGQDLKNDGKIRYQRVVEGDIICQESCTIDELGYRDIAGNVEFWQGDACNLKAHFSGYDLIMATNLIDRLYEPLLFLEEVHLRLDEGGYLILTSPYTWLEEYTKKEFWLGGYYDEEGNIVSS
ncbi:MAG: 5-histidylcysteine sulfoxide synthase, partial [Thiovulaceae bacterium]|nr:5-histidylcysteine sulfoxide synthase [Sulfurimonadaceae bacterium]